ncbi:NlpC-P60 family protein [Pseudoxanthomonas sp. SGD-10]|uniref:C40 family peptidase n=1 Tax=unclassified Pseudoxanthomonas TaxID=2645906 RepID=UPI0002EAF051|nr:MULTISPECIES: SH3 domain-containing protein [unclassified Pseudoxanthomonas]RRN78302.1 NlpC-P60 family protein [Pseudoxanthomonas sp. SGD-10]
MKALSARNTPVRKRVARLAAPLLASLLLAAAPAWSLSPDADGHTAVVGVRLSDLDPASWIARLEQPHQLLLDREGIAALNARMRAEDPSIQDIAALPDPLPRQFVRAQVEKLSSPPARTLYDERGQPVPARTLAALQRELALDAIPASRPLRYGLVVHRAALRAFPTSLRVFSSPGDTDIDRFQESALFPGDAVAVLHESRGRQWLFVASERYSAWIEARHVAIGTREEVLGYASRTPYIVVTGATVRTTYTPEEPRVSALQLDMGLRLPLRTGLDPSRTVNGQHPYASHVVDLPARRADGSLEFVPALVPRSADVAADYLPLTPANLIAQAFKFLGERYGWGHSYDARDCSGFVSEVYRSFGILMPRNTRDQAVSPALDRIGFEPGDDPARRQAAVRGLQVGDLVYIPGHVMMAIGHRDGMAYVIHDTNGGGWRGPDGGRVSAGLNGVSLTPLDPLLFNDEQTYVDRMTSIQRVRPRPSR